MVARGQFVLLPPFTAYEFHSGILKLTILTIGTYTLTRATLTIHTIGTELGDPVHWGIDVKLQMRLHCQCDKHPAASYVHVCYDVPLVKSNSPPATEVHEEVSSLGRKPDLPTSPNRLENSVSHHQSHQKKHCHTQHPHVYHLLTGTTLNYTNHSPFHLHSQPAPV